MRRRNRFYKENTKRSKKGFYIAIAVLFVVLQIVVTVQTATIGAQLSKLEKDEQELINNNRILTEEIIQSSSLMGTQEFAAQSGYVSVNTQFLQTDEVVAKLP